jgi:iron complex transport system ATP-binding protein
MVTVSLEAAEVKLGERTVVAGLSAELAAGSLIGVIGPNGAGKSTLVRALMGLVPLAGGAIRIDGAPVDTIAREDFARRIAYLPQGQELHWPLSVERLVALGRLPHLAPFSRMTEADAAAVENAMRRADILHLRHRNARELSGGERARALLARALAVEAKGLVADEPLASLDPGHQIDVMELLVGAARGGALVIAVLHDLTMAARHCDRLLLIDKGRLVADGPPAAVLTPPRLADTYGIDAHIRQVGESPLVVPLTRAGKAGNGRE